MALDSNELKALAIQLAAVMPPPMQAPDAAKTADAIVHTGVTLDGVAAFLEEQVQTEDLYLSRMAFTLAETVKQCIRDLEACAREVRGMGAPA